MSFVFKTLKRLILWHLEEIGKFLNIEGAFDNLLPEGVLKSLEKGVPHQITKLV
jgi:hypothetical protein